LLVGQAAEAMVLVIHMVVVEGGREDIELTQQEYLFLPDLLLLLQLEQVVPEVQPQLGQLDLELMDLIQYLVLLLLPVEEEEEEEQLNQVTL
jgi:hypothetical protein